VKQAAASSWREPYVHFAAVFLIAVIAFWPSFFSKLDTTDAAHTLHGVTAMLWLTIPMVQAWLISHGQYDLHRKVGYATVLLIAPVLVVSGLHMVQVMIVRYQQIHALRLLKFTFLDLSAMALFVLYLVLAVLHARRRDIDGHARYMAGTVLFALEPALERIFVFYVPGVEGFATALYLAVISMEVILAVLIVLEVRRGRIRLPFPLALGFFVLMQVFMTPVASSPRFAAFADWFAAIG
jgi:hypothetical protein